MTWLQKMDAVLNCLYDHSGDNPLFSELEKWLKDVPIHTGEIQDITLYLYREQMMYCEYNNDRTHPYVEFVGTHFLISCKGKLFVEGVGGFEKQNQIRLAELKETKDRSQRMERNEEQLVNWTQTLANRTRKLTNWTKVVALGAAGLVVWEIIHTLFFEEKSPVYFFLPSWF